MYVADEITISDARHIAGALGSGPLSLAPTLDGASGYLPELGRRSNALNDEWTLLELCSRRIYDSFGLASHAIVPELLSPKLDAIDRRQNAIMRAVGDIHRQMLAADAHSFDDVAVLLDAALDYDVDVQEFPGDRRALEHLLDHLSRLAPGVELRAIGRLAALGKVRLVDPEPSRGGDTCRPSRQRRRSPCSQLERARGDGDLKISELWRDWSTATDREEDLYWAGRHNEADAADFLCERLRHQMLVPPVRDMADVAALLDVALGLDVHPMEHPEDRPMLEHLVAQLATLAPSIEIGALRRLSSAAGRGAA